MGVFSNPLGTKKMSTRYDYLTNYTDSNNSKVIIEVGTWKGFSAEKMIRCAIKKHAPNEVYYYGFDVWEDMTDALFAKEFSKQPCSKIEVSNKLKKTGANIKLIKGESSKTLPKFIEEFKGDPDLIYIDGGHSIETIQNDWDNISKIVTKNTIVLFDDYYELHSGNQPINGCNATINSLDRKAWDVEILQNYDEFAVCKGVGGKYMEGRKIFFAKVTKK